MTSKIQKQKANKLRLKKLIIKYTNILNKYKYQLAQIEADKKRDAEYDMRRRGLL